MPRASTCFSPHSCIHRRCYRLAGGFFVSQSARLLREPECTTHCWAAKAPRESNLCMQMSTCDAATLSLDIEQQIDHETCRNLRELTCTRRKCARTGRAQSPLHNSRP